MLVPSRALGPIARSGLLVAMAVAAVINLTATGAAEINYERAKARFAETARAELDRKVVPGFSVAWVVDGQVVHAAGYGFANPDKKLAADADTLYRAGSISKLFNAVSAMQLVTQGKLDLDAPIQKALPDFQITIPFEDATPLTIRQMLCHRSGMIREAPVGGYLDPSQPTVAATIASVASCVLVNRPNTKTRYSNVGPTIVGRALEVQTGMSFSDYQQKYVLGPLGMPSSVWTMNPSLHPRFAQGQMRVAVGDGSYKFEPAPEFELGTIPAGNLYTSANDLAKFASFMMGAKSSDTQLAEAHAKILPRAELEKMFEPQLVNQPTGFGLGFLAGKYRDHKTAQHNGAVYGFSTSLVVLREPRIAAIILTNGDIASSAVKRLNEASLDLLLETVRGESAPAPLQTIILPAAELAPLAGEYESPSYWARVFVEGGALKAEISGQQIALTPTEPLKFLADGRILSAGPIEFERDDKSGTIPGFAGLGQKFRRIDPGKAPRAPEAWQKFVGVYGEPFIPLVVSVRNGRLYATVENEYDYHLTPLDRVTFNLPPGMYSDEQVVFQTDPGGKVLGVLMANMYLPRRDK